MYSFIAVKAKTTKSQMKNGILIASHLQEKPQAQKGLQSENVKHPNLLNKLSANEAAGEKVMMRY